jgi:hypothetical protein
MDFKAKHALNAGEHAKDIAAFANAFGGVLLIGVSETADSFSRCLMPIEDARDVVRAYDDAARDLLAPRVTVDCLAVTPPENELQALVAVNVDPFPGQMVGAKLPQTEGWRFPVRTAARHSAYYDPEKIMLYADPRTRKSAILLSSVSKKGTVYLQVIFRQEGGSAADESDELCSGEFRGLDLATNTAEFGCMLPDRSAMVHIVAPIEDVEAVWYAHAHWHVRLDGTVRRRKLSMRGGSETFYFSGRRGGDPRLVWRAST